MQMKSAGDHASLPSALPSHIEEYHARRQEGDLTVVAELYPSQGARKVFLNASQNCSSAYEVSHVFKSKECIASFLSSLSLSKTKAGVMYNALRSALGCDADLQ